MADIFAGRVRNTGFRLFNMVAMASDLIQFLRQFVQEDRLKRFDEVVVHRTRHLAVVLENIFHPHNASACLRTCDCFGVQNVQIVEDINRFNPSGDVSRGANRWLDITRYRQTSEQDEPGTIRCINHLHETGYRVLATSPRQNSKPLNEITVDSKTAIIFGGEKNGVTETAIEMADDLVHIPMYGFSESFNISVSVALCLQHLTNQLRRSDIDWELDAEAQEALLDRWVKLSIGHKLDPLVRRFEQENAGV